MNKKAISLVEVMVSIALISTVIVATLKMQDNNIFNLKKFKENSLNNGYISLVTTVPIDQKRNITIRVGDKINLDDDDIRKELKDIKVFLKDKEAKDIDLPENDYIKTAKVLNTTYSIDNKIQKTFYTFKLQ